MAAARRGHELRRLGIAAAWAAVALGSHGVRMAAQVKTPPPRTPITTPTKAAAAVAPQAASATITYLSGATVYLEIGTKQGVVEGTTFTVSRGGTVIAELAASFVSSTRTSCSITRGTVPLVVGDSVRYVAAPPPQEAISEVTTRGVAPAANRGRRAPLRGRIGVRYLMINQGGGSTLRQPSLDFRLDGSEINGTSLGVAVDVRMQRNSVSGASTSTTPGSTRVYQAAVMRQRGSSGTRWALGRQFATALSPIGIFDGLALDLNGTHVSGGALAGTQPDAATFAPSGARTEAGLWLQGHNAPGSSTPWSTTVGAIGSYDRGRIDREFLYLRGTISSRAFSLYAAEEVDANRGWKRKMAGSFATLTSTVLTAQVNMSDAIAVSGGIDSRRSVRLYRDFINPEIAFDDALRQGQWGELSLRPSRHLRLSGDIRHSGGGQEGGSQAITAALSATQLTSLGLGLRARSTQYTGALSEGRLSSVALEAAPNSIWRLSLNGGVRTSSVPGSGTPATKLTWAGGDLDVAVGRSLYLMLSTYRESGTAASSVQTYVAVTWRF